MTPAQVPHWWNRTRHADRRPFLLARGRIKSAIRAWFEAQGFVEVETSALQVSPGNETHLQAFTTTLVQPNGAVRPLYLHTSPEFACKKLLAAGEKKIFTFANAFRNNEAGPLHEPEFMMLEWYVAGAGYRALMDHCAALMRIAADVTGGDIWAHNGRSADPRQTPERVQVAEIIHQATGIDIGATIVSGSPDRSLLRNQARSAGIRIAPDDTWSDIFTRLLLEYVEPRLGQGRAVFLDRYPLPEAALAKPAHDDARFAERFELYCCGIELANGFGELTDPKAQRARFEADMAEKQRIYGASYPIDEDFMAALADMPDAYGCALASTGL